MIYCDTAHLLKYYVDEPGSQEVRSLIDRQTGVGSLSLGRLELAAAFHRKLRESQIAPDTHECLVSQFEADNMAGLWTWFDVTPALLDKASKNFAILPAKFSSVPRTPFTWHARRNTASAKSIPTINTSSPLLSISASRAGM